MPMPDEVLATSLAASASIARASKTGPYAVRCRTPNGFSVRINDAIAPAGMTPCA